MKTTSKAVNRPNSTILKSVTKPGRYAGGEYGQIIKDKTRVTIETISKAVWPMIIACVITLLVITYIPIFSTIFVGGGAA